MSEDNLKEDREMLAEFVKKFHPRMDWHEPDEQGISAVIHGDHLDNAFGNAIDDKFSQEFVVELKVDGKRKMLINLSTLFAIATENLR